MNRTITLNSSHNILITWRRRTTRADHLRFLGNQYDQQTNQGQRTQCCTVYTTNVAATIKAITTGKGKIMERITIRIMKQLLSLIHFRSCGWSVLYQPSNNTGPDLVHGTLQNVKISAVEFCLVFCLIVCDFLVFF